MSHHRRARAALLVAVGLLFVAVLIGPSEPLPCCPAIGDAYQRDSLPYSTRAGGDSTPILADGVTTRLRRHAIERHQRGDSIRALRCWRRMQPNFAGPDLPIPAAYACPVARLPPRATRA